MTRTDSALLDAPLFREIQSSSKPAPKIVAHDAPQIIKYMGSKAQILPFVIDGINQVYDGGGVCDLFAGSCILSGFIGRNVRVFSNDIQTYSQVLAGFYLTAWKDSKSFIGADEIIAEATEIAAKHLTRLPLRLSYARADTLEEFNTIEKRNRNLIRASFDWKWHLFAKNYSGTWWSAEQCVLIDAIREVAEKHRNKPHYNLILASLLHAMAYSSSGTGHYAQYRDATTASNMRDISIYRRRDLAKYFVRKYQSLAEFLPTRPPKFKHELTALDYRERLATLPRCTVYADPPYAFVHYSRFYHAMETVCLYDFPKLQEKGGAIVKGRYREGRHQSPFCIRSQVPSAFENLFSGVVETESNLVLSYSKNGMIGFNELLELARHSLKGYRVSVETSDHQHMTMGRRADRHRDVKEVLILARR